MKNFNCILLIDDNPADNFIHRTFLNMTVQVEHIDVALHGGHAMTYLRVLLGNKKPFPELIFLDINMPVMNGFEFLDACAEFSDALKDTVLLMLSSSENPADIERSLAYPYVKGFYKKPLRDEEINAIAEKYFSEVR